MRKTLGISGWTVMTMVIGAQAMFTAQDVQAAILYVGQCPGMYPRPVYCSIQEAIGDAQNGDTVMVYPGTYAPAPGYPYSWRDKNITVMSMSGAAVTFIDLAGSGRAFKLQSYFDEIQITNASLIKGFTITNGDTNNGAAIRLADASPTIVGCIFKDNTVTNSGGAIYMLNCVQPVPVLSCTFTGNTAGTFGGAIYMSGGTLLLNGCTLSGNSAQVGGGAIYLLRSAATITGTSFYGNATTDSGGDGGGGICSVPTTTSHVLTLVDSKMNNNTTLGQVGGAIAYYAGGLEGEVTMLSVDRCEFHNNRCVGQMKAQGGAIFVAVPESFTSPDPGTVPLAKIDNSFISHNVAECTGTSVHNMAQGGGIYASSATPDPEEDLSFGIKICNSTIADNKTIIPDEAATKSGGGGFYSQNHKAEVTNSIFWGNVSPENGTQIGVEETITIAYSDVDETVGGCSEGTGIWMHDVTGLLICGDGNLNVDPSFVDPDTWDYHLEGDSLVINEGDPAGGCGDYDIDLDDRVCDFQVDMGADEICD